MRPAPLAVAAACGPPDADPVQQSTAAAPAQHPAEASAAAAATPTGAAATADRAATPTPSGSGEKPKDVEITSCSVDPTLHRPSAELSVTNHDTRASTYLVRVEFVDATGTRIGEGTVTASGLAPDRPTVLKAQGTTTATGRTSCRLVEVTHYATP
ncbi:hypothetical protein [Streptomyces sp. NRRL B-24484]|uniref:hypothetical protein n=1 Tax=Streptomyces sp. NRRL B-24484 TaxID=1463833 RepID=UPI0004C22EEB|nr:hypothetical protein [Streptomyces sp. NRRL B-24484]